MTFDKIMGLFSTIVNSVPWHHVSLISSLDVQFILCDIKSDRESNMHNCNKVITFRASWC